MQSILSIDASSEPAFVTVAEVNGGSVRVLQSFQMPVGRIFHDCYELRAETDSTDDSIPVYDDEPEGDEQPPAPEETSQRPIQIERLRSFFENVLGQVEYEWTNSILIVPPFDYLSLNIELPFNDPKSINKIIDLEVQDLVPFDVADFLVDHFSIDQSESGQYETHVSIVPKSYIRTITAAFKDSNFEPFIVSTPTSALAAIFHIAPDYFPPDCAIILAADPIYCIIIRIGGQIRCDRVLHKRALGLNNGHMPAGAEQLLATEFKLTLSQVEQRYQTRIETVYVTGGSLSNHVLQKTLGRTIQSFSPSEFLEESAESSERPDLSGISAVFPQDANAPSVLTNFRTGEFSYSPQIKELLNGLRSLAPYLIGIILMGCITLLTVYGLRERKISSLRSMLQTKIQETIPETGVIPEGQEAQTIAVQLRALDSQLRELGSISNFTPLDALLKLSQDLPMSAGISEIAELRIKNNRVTLRGNFNAVGAIDSLEAMLKQKSGTYCSYDINDSGNATKTFRVTIDFCEAPN